LKRYRISKEDESHFEIDHGDGNPFRVAKKGLDKKTLANIPKFADGGSVWGKILPSARAMGEAGKPEYTRGSAAESLARPAAASTMGPETGGETDTRSLQEMGLEQTTPTATAPPAATLETPLPPVELPKAPKSVGEKDETMGMLKEGLKLSKTAYDKEAVEAEAMGKDRAAQTQKYLDDTATNDAAHKAETIARMQQLAQESQDIKNFKINPNRAWEQKNIGQKISAMIGLILGGIGGGITGQPNAALGIIDKMIDRDIDAQQKDLENKHTHYRAELEKGHMADESYKLADARLRNNLATQLDMAADRHKGPQARAAADAAIGQLTTHAASNINQVMTSKAQRQHMALTNQFEQTKMGWAEQDRALQQDAINRYMKTGEVSPYLPPHLLERQVPGEAPALTAEGAKTRRTQQAGETEARETLKQRPETGLGIMAKIPGTPTHAAVQGWARQQAEALARAHGYTRPGAADAIMPRVLEIASMNPYTREDALKRLNEELKVTTGSRRKSLNP